MSKEKKESNQAQGGGVEKPKAALYTRVPAKQINPNASLDAQEKQLRKFCEKEGIEVVKVYCDVAHGHNYNRTEFKKFLNDVVMKKILVNYLIFTKAQVFGTNIAEMVKMHTALTGLGVTPLCLEPIDVIHIIFISKDDKNQNEKK